ncbi:hypothetical protein GIB67_008284 [Kingdonia uniflora]|uniref:Glutathione S-transferase n=1 Tax=Kingdonia uniflora TaxID=39325 RepID=A0A7J7N4T8_9MAGN|nr:hypothetical protein GIB67_008284 [Kingdonia uniflora]
MEDLKLHGSIFSPFTWRVIWALKLKGLNFEFIQEDMTNKSDLLLKYNPVYKKIPVLVHGGKPIVESSIILEYIEETWPQNPLLPVDPYEKAVARFWSKFADDKILTLYYGFFMKVGEEQEKAVQEGLEILRNLEEHGLGDKKFFGGETIGLADVGLGWIAYWLNVLEEIVGIKLLEESKFPRLFEWTNNFKEISIIKENLPDRDEMMAFLKSRYDGLRVFFSHVG